jgi:hypothetical protein
MNMLHFSHEAGFRILRKVFTLGFKTKTKSLQIAHCHGAGGSGYKFSRGVARRVVELVKDVWNTQNVALEDVSLSLCLHATYHP